MKTHELVMPDADFETQTGKGLVLIDFWAPRCGPCRIQGPMTGRASGFCAGLATPGYLNPAGRRGFRMRQGCGGQGGTGPGCRRGGGRGSRNMFRATGPPGWMRGDTQDAASPAPEQELDALKRQAEFLVNALDNIRKRVKDKE